jgi:multiple sugar transport system substrate-binding protein
MSTSERLRRRRLIGVAPVVAAGAGAAGPAAVGCAPRQSGQPALSQEPVTINVLLDPTLNTRFTQMAPVIPTFEAAFPKVRPNVELTTNPGVESREKFKAKLAAGDVIDVFGDLASDFVAGFARLGGLKELGPPLARQRVVNAKDYWASPLASVTYKGKLYGLPHQVFTQLLMYNKDLLAREGHAFPAKEWTWERVLDVAKAITRPGAEGRPTQWGMVWTLNGFRTAGLVLMWAHGGRLFDDDENPRSLSLDPAGAAGVQWLVDLFVKHRVAAQAADAAAAGVTNTDQLLATGNVGFNYSSLTWRPYRSYTSFKADVQMLPRGPARQVGGTWAGCLTMPATSKNPDAALDFITHVTGPAGQKLMIPVVDQFPSVESIAASKEWLEFDGLNRQAAVDMIKLAKPIPPTPAWDDIQQTALNPLFAELLAGRKTALDGLREIKPKVDDLLRAVG